VRSRGRGYDTDHDVDRGLVDFALGPHVELTLAGPLYATASANAVVALVRQQTTMTDATGKSVLLSERSALGGELGLGLGVRFSP
jgi:hypothetical protein